MLALRAGEIVSTEHLTATVWGEAAPPGVANTLQSHVSFLRRVVGSKTAILARPPGYVLDLGDEATDVQVAERLIREGTRAGDCGYRAGQLRAALALWRGPSLADVAGLAWLEEQAGRLDQMRQEASRALIEARMELGEHARLVADLERLTTDHPFDERIHELLMLALYRSGRQADALAVYQRLRQTLRTDLGIDPSPPLRQIETAILRQDPLLAPSRPAIAPPLVRAAAPMPAQLPPAVHAFAGRGDELARLDLALSRAASANMGRNAAIVISAVSGTAGVGKTALAVHWAHRVAAHFPDGQLYVNLRGFEQDGTAMSPEVALRGFLDALGVPPERIPAGLDAQAALYRSVLDGKRALVVLDNARDTAQVRPLLPGAAGCLVVVTSRDQLRGLVTVEGAHPLIVDVLTAAEARDLLASRLGKQRLASEPRAVDEIITRTAGLPLALAIVAARAATHPSFPLATLAAELRDARTRLNALEGEDPATQVRAVFYCSYRTLSADAAKMFRLLGLHPGPDVTVPAAASLAGIPARHAERLLAELARAHMATERVFGRYTAHDLLHVYAANLARTVDSDSDRHGALRRLFDHYLHAACACDRLLDPVRDPIPLPAASPGVSPEEAGGHQQALAWLTAEHAVLREIGHMASSAGFDTHTWQLAWALTTFHQRRVLRQDWVATYIAAVDAVRRLREKTPPAASPGDLGDAHRELGRAYSAQGRYADSRAHLRKALDLYAEIGDLIGQAHTHRYLAILAEEEERLQEGVDHAGRSIDLFRAAGHRPGEAKARNALGWALARQKDYGQALTHCRRALAMLQELGDRDGEAQTWHSIGYAYHHLGDHGRALSCYQRAAALFRELGDRYFEAYILVYLGETHRAAGDPDSARDAWKCALGILDEIGHPRRDQVIARLRALQ